jgi:hypothetical protein
MQRRICPIAGLCLLVLLVLGLTVGYGGSRDRAAQQQAELDAAIEEYSQAIALDPEDAAA